MCIYFLEIRDDLYRTLTRADELYIQPHYDKSIYVSMRHIHRYFPVYCTMITSGNTFGMEPIMTDS